MRRFRPWGVVRDSLPGENQKGGGEVGQERGDLVKKGLLQVKRHPSGSRGAEGGGPLKCKLWGSSLLRARELGLATGCGRMVWRGLHTPGASISVASRQGSSSGPRAALQKGWQVGRKIPRPNRGAWAERKGRRAGRG